MAYERYKTLIKKCERLVGVIDGDDVNKISHLVYNLVFEDTTKTYNELQEDLDDMTNILWCEYGLDYGQTKNWDDTTIKIIGTFKHGYTKNSRDIDTLISIIYESATANTSSH